MKKLIFIVIFLTSNQIFSQTNGNLPIQSTDNSKQKQLLDLNPSLKNLELNPSIKDENLDSKYPVESIPIKNQSLFDYIFDWLKTIKTLIKENLLLQFLIVMGVIYSGYLNFKKKKEDSLKE